MNKHSILMIWCLVMGALVSCSKDEADPAPAPVAVQDYMPVTTKTTWSYGGTVPHTTTITGATKVINGRTFHEMETKDSDGTRKSYLLKEDGVYTGIGIVPITGSQEIIILKEKAPVGEKWEQQGTIQGAAANMKFEIVEKDVSKTVAGKTYANVIYVKMELNLSLMGQDLGGLIGHLYFAKGVGMILSDFGALGQAPLLTYDIK